MSDAQPLRLAHISDLHVTARGCGWRLEDWFNKRLAAWLNLRMLGRGYRFRHAEAVLTALMCDLDERRPETILFSGDAVSMGFEEEMALAARLARVDHFSGVAVPGNHDYCTRTAQREGIFERHFAPWQVGERLGSDIYPFARKIGHAWIVAVNSATANRWPWDARGGVGAAQLARLETLLTQIGEGPRILVTHYPIARAGGWPEPPVRHLRDLRDMIAICEKGKIGLWLHGHCHGAYHFPAGRVAPFPVICAGSATQVGLWSYGEYVLTGHHLAARIRIYDGVSAFKDGTAFEIELTKG